MRAKGSRGSDVFVHRLAEGTSTGIKSEHCTAVKAASLVMQCGSHLCHAPSYPSRDGDRGSAIAGRYDGARPSLRPADELGREGIHQLETVTSRHLCKNQ